MAITSAIFQIKESPEGDWNDIFVWVSQRLELYFQIKESPEGDWNLMIKINDIEATTKTFKLKNPRKGTETV